MDALFDCIAEEEDPRVKAVLGPYIFTFIHPYMDGNGRNARFLMNALLAEGGFPWTVIPVDRRTEYMACLEAASNHENIKPLAAFIAELVASPPPPRPKETTWSQRNENGPEAAAETNDEASDDSSRPEFRIGAEAPATALEQTSSRRTSSSQQSKKKSLIGRLRNAVSTFWSDLRAVSNETSELRSLPPNSGPAQIVEAIEEIIAPVLDQHLAEIRVFRRGGGGGGQTWEGYRDVFTILQSELDRRYRAEVFYFE